MTDLYIEQVSLKNIDAVYPETMLSLFWEQGIEEICEASGHHCSNPQALRTKDLEGFVQGYGVHSQPGSGGGPLQASSAIGPELADQIRLEKEAWLNTVFLSWGPCGYSLRKKLPGASSDSEASTVGTLLFAPPRFCPTTFSMPSGPVSPDAIALTSLHYNPLEVDSEMLCALIASTLHKLALRGVHAVEAFGCSQAMNGAADNTAQPQAADALGDGEESFIADFEEQLEEALNPKPCVSDSLTAINHKAGELIRTRTLIDAGFTVVNAHPVHPKLRIELDAALDWDEEVGHALDLSAKEPFVRSTMFSI